MTRKDQDFQGRPGPPPRPRVLGRLLYGRGPAPVVLQLRAGIVGRGSDFKFVGLCGKLVN
jgi:hypothetical protein